MLLSFCITNMNRTCKLKKTLKKNLEDNKNLKDKIEFILVDFNSKDGCKEYILNNFKEELRSDYLKYYWTDQLLSWHASIAKNTAHILANGKYVTNLDCDNFVGEFGGEFLIDLLEENAIIHQSKNIMGSGTMGRITISKENFLKLGGYNESMFPMAYQDSDLIRRAKLLNLNYQNYDSFNDAIINSKDEALENTNFRNYNSMGKINQLISNLNFESKIIKVNNYKKNNNIGIESKFIKRFGYHNKMKRMKKSKKLEFNNILLDKTKKNFELVIARYDEDISWSDEYIDFRTVYNKGNHHTDYKYIKLENKGHLADTVLRHIIDNYDNLADVTLFAHGCLNYRDDQKINLNEYISIDKNTLIYAGEKVPHGSLRWYNYDESLEQVYSKIFNKKFTNNLEWAKGKWISVSKEIIRNCPKSIYQKMLDFVLEDYQGKEPSQEIYRTRGIYIERLLLHAMKNLEK